MLFEFGVKHFLEQILKAPVIGLHNSIFGRHIKRPLAVNRIEHTGTGEITDAFVEIIHRHGDATAREVKHFKLFAVAAVFGFPFHGQLAFAGHDKIGGAILVAKSMTANDNWIRPTRHKTRHIAANNRLAEHGATQNITDRAVGRFPHLLQAKFFNPRLIRCDGRALHADADFFNGFG